MNCDCIITGQDNGLRAGSDLTNTKMISHSKDHLSRIDIESHRYYSLYKKKRKHYIIFNNLSTFTDEHFKLTG